MTDTDGSCSDLVVVLSQNVCVVTQRGHQPKCLAPLPQYEFGTLRTRRTVDHPTTIANDVYEAYGTYKVNQWLIWRSWNTMFSVRVYGNQAVK